MPTVIIVADPARFNSLQAGIESRGGAVRRSPSAEAALAAVAEAPVDLVVADETLDDMSGEALARKLVAANPLINCALVSALAPKAFHEATEGLGILMQLPPAPQQSDGEELMARLNQILGLAAS